LVIHQDIHAWNGNQHPLCHHGRFALTGAACHKGDLQFILDPAIAYR
jgi:hypothetical protein